MIWILGINGFLGKELKYSLSLDNIPFVGTGKEIDITDLSSLLNFSENKKIDWVINCAGYTAVDKAESEKEKAFALNSLGTKNIAIVSAKINAKLIHISTNYVFPGNTIIPYCENRKKRQIGVYGESKNNGEDLLIKENNNYYIIRTSWLFGHNKRNILFDNKGIISGNTYEFASPTYVQDLCNGIKKILLCKKDHFGVYHFVNSGFTSRYNLFKTKVKYAKKYKLISRKITVLRDYKKGNRPFFTVLCTLKFCITYKVIIPSWRNALKRYVIKERDYLEK